jgi:CBS domain containing-hemolysin-like protein
MDIVHLIQSAVAPVFLLSGVGVTLGVLTNRLARIVDRARFLEQLSHAEAARAKSTGDSLRALARRAHYINIAITLCTIAALLVSLVVMSLFTSAFVSINLSALIAILFVLAMVCLSAAFGAFLIEVRLATSTLVFGARH